MPNSEIKIFQSEDGNTEVQVELEDETVWLSLNQIVTLFDRDKSVISRHVNNIFKEQELDKNSVVAKNAANTCGAKPFIYRWKQKNSNLSVLVFS